jgi:hypothetical protein
LEVAERVSSVTETVAIARADSVCDSGGDINARDSFVKGATFLQSESSECARFLSGRLLKLQLELLELLIFWSRERLHIISRHSDG